MVRNHLKKLPKSYTFGIELEFSGGLTCAEAKRIIHKMIQNGQIREGWKVHYDSSVVDENGYGAEIISPVLRDDAQTEKEIRLITAMIKNYGGVMNEKTGGHIHFGLQCIGNDIQDIKNFFKLYTIFEPLLYNLSTGDLGYLRPSIVRYAKPLQDKLIKVIDGDINSLSELMTTLMASVGANIRHYGEFRYFGLNFQRIVEAIRERPDGMNVEEFLQKIFSGEEVLNKDGNKISPTIEMRFRNGSSDADEILSGIRMNGQLFVAARRKNSRLKSMINSFYRKMKRRVHYNFEQVTQEDIDSGLYTDCNNLDEILERKFYQSIYGFNHIDFRFFHTFMTMLYPDMSQEEIIIVYNEINQKKQSKYQTYQIQTNDYSYHLNNHYQYAYQCA